MDLFSHFYDDMSEDDFEDHPSLNGLSDVDELSTDEDHDCVAYLDSGMSDEYQGDDEDTDSLRISGYNGSDSSSVSSVFDSSNDETHASGNHIPFTGSGKCECGCASFVGSGKMCRACGHPWEAHYR